MAQGAVNNPGERLHLYASQDNPAGRMSAWRAATRHLWSVQSLDSSRECEAVTFRVERLLVGHVAHGGQRIGNLPLSHLNGREVGLILLVLLEGELAGEVDGIAIRAVPGDLCLFDQGRKFTASLSAGSALVVQFPGNTLLAGPLESEVFHGSVLRGTHACCQIARAHLTKLLELCPRLIGHELAQVYETTVAFTRAVISCFVETRQEVVSDDEAQSLPDPLVRYVETHLSDPGFSATALARAFGMSRAALYRLFEPTGGIARYIRRRRLRKAMADIANPRMRNTRFNVISARWGFENEDSFAKAMRREFGVTPSALRERSRQGAETAEDQLPLQFRNPSSG